MKVSCYQEFRDKLETHLPASHRALILRNMLKSSDEVMRGYAEQYKATIIQKLDFASNIIGEDTRELFESILNGFNKVSLVCNIVSSLSRTEKLKIKDYIEVTLDENEEW